MKIAIKRTMQKNFKHKKHRVTEITEKLSTKSYTLYRMSFVVNHTITSIQFGEAEDRSVARNRCSS